MASAWFKNVFLLKINQWTSTPEQLEVLLAAHSLQPCGGSELQSVGWVPPKDKADLFVHRNQQQLLIALGVESRLLPASVIADHTQERIAAIEDQRGSKVGGKEKKEIKEAVMHELLPRAFVQRNKTFAWVDPVNGWLVVNASSEGAANEVVEALRKVMDTKAFSVELVNTKTSPVAAMTGWLAGDDLMALPARFTVDMDCELKNGDGEKASVRYANHNLDAAEIPAHIVAGKTATKLAMTWQNKISFVLTDSFQLKKIKPLDVVKEQGAAADDMFDGDFAIMSGELGLLIGELVAELGGLVAAADAVQ